MRFLADIPDDDIQWLDALAAEQGVSRAELVRRAVTAYRADVSGDAIDNAFGIWRARDDIGDGLKYQRRLRGKRE
ncbi:CopG family transcriptional regulator [Sphingopyxis sp. Root214]|uniref:ribbon-helix-helix domain-containing protein n=1 Tax=unclassified Sphingopyxis TaxID=2614943 RepID=UPI0006FB6800|nr:MULTISPECIES: CopG family transcriptional regulator [unclassified Sphingopyxis]KQZ71600.1 CopG family transcriptional regulator [Sphingopyxis sp. Root154]KRC05509.1 CopG family transcriptional regulator [Sphingopyxis sp. Root214]